MVLYVEPEALDLLVAQSKGLQDHGMVKRRRGELSSAGGVPKDGSKLGSDCHVPTPVCMYHTIAREITG